MNSKFLEIVKKYSSPHSKLKIVTEGWDHVIIIVDEKQVFRFPKIKSYQENLIKEKRFLDLFSGKTSVSTPRLELHTEFNLTYATYPLIAGQAFSFEYAQTLDSKKLLTIAKEIANFLKTIHELPLNSAQQIGLSVMNPVLFWPEKQKQFQILFKDYLDKEILLQLAKKFEKFIEKIQNVPFKQTVNHSDLKPPHILISPENSLAGVIDFSEVVIGDPAYDFQYLGRYPKIFVEELFENYHVDNYFIFRQQFYEYLSYFELLESAIKYNRQESIIAAKKDLLKVM